MKTIPLVIASIVIIPNLSSAATITLGTASTRIASLTSATHGITPNVNGTVTDSDLRTLSFGGFNDWEQKAEDTSSSTAVGDLFVIAITSPTGAFGEKGPMYGTWSITDANFWSIYSNVAISMHVGGGNRQPDNFVWLLESNGLSGSWTYDGTGIQQGGGLSNFKLHARGVGQSVPDGGTTLLLLGGSLLGLGSIRRLFAAKA